MCIICLYVYTCSHARGEPGTAVPFINGPWTVSNINGFLLLMTDGLFETYGKLIGSTKPQEIHNGLAKLVAEEMRCQASLEGVAQAVVEGVKHSYKQKVRRGKLDDITLIIYNFGYPLPRSPPQKIPDHFQSQYPPAHPSYPPHIAQSGQHYIPSPSMPLQPSEGYFSPKSTSPPHGASSYRGPTGGGSGYTANYPAEGEQLLNVGHQGLTSSSSEGRLDLYPQDNSQYPTSNAAFGGERPQAVPMQRVSSGPLHLNEAMAGIRLSPLEPDMTTPKQEHHPLPEQSPSQQPFPTVGEHRRGDHWVPVSENEKTVTPGVNSTDHPGRQPTHGNQSMAGRGDSSCIDSYVKFPADFPHNLGIDDF